LLILVAIPVLNQPIHPVVVVYQTIVDEQGFREMLSK